MIKKHKSLFDPRNYYKPFEYPQAYEFYEMHEKMHWLVDEVPMHQDVLDWKNKLTNQEKHFLTQIFRLFTQSDVDVAGAYANKYIPLFPKPEIRMMLLSFAAREAIHIQAYSHLIDTLGMSEATYKAFMEYEAMREKHDFIEEFMGTDQNMIVQQIAAFSAFTEGMQLFSSFIMLLNFTRFNKMNGMGQIITWSIKDESVHVDGMTWLFKEFLKEHKDIWTDDLKRQLYKIAEKMVELEDKFIDLAYELVEDDDQSEVFKNLTKNEVKQYIRYIADRRLIGLGMKGIFKIKNNPLPWVEEILNAPEHANFFEQRATAYSKGSLTGDWGKVWK
jgi:ribonucleoside-diphosphate reductase beta chain